MSRLLRWNIAVLLVTLTATSCFAADWMQFGYDSAHSSNNTAESILTAGNVSTVTALYSHALPEAIDGAPVYLSNVQTASGVKYLLFATTLHGTALALDAADGSIVWSKAPTASSVMNGSPAIDPNRQFVYMAMPDGKIHKYAVGDGTETIDANWPEISTLKPTLERANGSLAIATHNGTSYLYAVVSGFQDGGDYQGHLTTINLSTGTQVVFNSLCSNQAIHFDRPPGDQCNSTQSGIWGRGGPVYDASLQRLFVTTGNGPYDASTGGNNWADSVIALAPDGTPATPGVPYDSYTPGTFQYLGDHDLDLGSMSVAIVPAPAGSAVTHLGMQAGKDESMRLINLADLSGAGGPRHTGGEIQLIPNPQEYDGAREQSAVWVDSTGASWVFYASFRNGLYGYKLGLAGSQIPQLTALWHKSSGIEVGTTSPVVANGVLYHVGMNDGAVVNSLVARNPVTGSVLWSSPTLTGIHWQSPIVVNGAIYASDIESGTAYLKAYGIAGTHATHVVTPVAGPNGSLQPGTAQTVNDGATTQFTVVPDSGYGIGTVSGCGGSLSGNVFTTAAVTADCTVTASFVALPPLTHTVTPTANAGGTITPSVAQTVDDGDTVAFTLAPDAGFEIAHVSGCGGTLDNLVYTTAPVTADCTVVAVFSAIGDDTIFADGFDP